MRPFQLVPYNYENPATPFTDYDSANLVLKSCTLRLATVKIPNNTTEIEISWLNKSYVDLTVSDGTVLFKVYAYIILSKAMILEITYFT